MTPWTTTAPRETTSVADIPDDNLIERAVRNAGSDLPRQPRWVAVRDAFALGSTYAGQLCRRFGLDPEENVGIAQEEECGHRRTSPGGVGKPSICDDCGEEL